MGGHRGRIRTVVSRMYVPCVLHSLSRFCPTSRRPGVRPPSPLTLIAARGRHRFAVPGGQSCCRRLLVTVEIGRGGISGSRTLLLSDHRCTLFLSSSPIGYCASVRSVCPSSLRWLSSSRSLDDAWVGLGSDRRTMASVVSLERGQHHYLSDAARLQL